MTMGNEFNTLLDPALKKIFFDEFEKGIDMIPALFQVESSDTYEEVIASILDSGDIPEFTGTLEYEDMKKGYEKTYTPKEYAKGLSVKRSLIDDGKDRIVKSIIVNRAMQVYNTRQNHAASIFNDAFAGDTHTCPDGLSLCNAAHTSLGDVGNQSNVLALTLAASAVETARTTMMGFKTAAGQPANASGNILLVSPSNISLATRICNSEGYQGTGNNDMNSLNSIRPVVWNRLSNSDAWFLIDENLMKKFNLWFERVSAEFARTENFDGILHKFRSYMRHSYGPASWEWIIGSNPV